MRYLFFNEEMRIIKILKLLLSSEHMIVNGREIEDIQQFKPDKVFCFENKDVVEECFKLKKKCVVLTTKEDETFKENVLFLEVKLFDLNQIKYDTNYSFSMIDETCKEVLRISDIYNDGCLKIFNESFVSGKDIMKFYKIKKDLQKNENNFVKEKSENIVMNNINGYFLDDQKWKVNIYLPTYYRFEKTKKSVESILKSSFESKYDVVVYIGDNNTKDEKMKNWLKNLDCDIFFSGKNVGKSGIVNHLHTKRARKCDFIFSIDTDMYPENTKKNFIDEMIFYLTRCQNVGLVSSNQTGFSQHWWDRTIYRTILDGLEVGVTTNGLGIAGGCLVMRTDDWEKIGMYKENHDVYTGDDGILTHKVIKILGKQPVIAVGCNMFHPHPTEDEKGYTEWKMESWKRDNTQFMKDDFKGENKTGFYD